MYYGHTSDKISKKNSVHSVPLVSPLGPDLKKATSQLSLEKINNLSQKLTKTES